MLTHKSPGRARSLAGAACLGLLALGTGYAAWAAAPAAVDAPIAALPPPGPTLVEEIAPEPAPGPQSLTNNGAPSPARPEAVEQEGDVLRTFSLKLDPPAQDELVADQVFIIRREQDGPPPERLMMEKLVAGAHRIECRKTNDGPLTCTRDGAPVEGEELERLRSTLPVLRGEARLKIGALVGPEGARGEDRTLTIVQRRRPAE